LARLPMLRMQESLLPEKRTGKRLPHVHLTIRTIQPNLYPTIRRTYNNELSPFFFFLPQQRPKLDGKIPLFFAICAILSGCVWPTNCVRPVPACKFAFAQEPTPKLLAAALTPNSARLSTAISDYRKALELRPNWSRPRSTSEGSGPRRRLRRAIACINPRSTHLPEERVLRNLALPTTRKAISPTPPSNSKLSTSRCPTTSESLSSSDIVTCNSENGCSLTSSNPRSPQRLQLDFEYAYGSASSNGRRREGAIRIEHVATSSNSAMPTSSPVPPSSTSMSTSPRAAISTPP